ncbi:hypothetical protein [Streptomyces aureus]|uniref:SnoaL-like domain-containing protein n=1 Tax=Streptomyces aureus TaxID=193461 RepID=A0ABV4SXZ8_9ACTN
MNGTGDIQKRREDIAIDYFRMADASNPAVIDLFTDDAHMFYPKFGIATGKAQIGAFTQDPAFRGAPTGVGVRGGARAHATDGRRAALGP